jgi:hypothetical protein
VNQASADMERKEPESPGPRELRPTWESSSGPRVRSGPAFAVTANKARRERLEWQITEREKRLAEIEAVGCHWRLVHD